MPKVGELRDDGFRFRGMNRGYECWLSPEGWGKLKERASKYHRERREKIKADPEALAAYRAYMALRNREGRKNDPVPFMLRAAKNRAKAKGLPFNLQREDVIIPKRCPVLGIRLTVGVGSPTDNSPELDRIVGRRGYVKGNIIVISRKANRIKTDATVKELVSVAKFYSSLSSRGSSALP